ncbi:hypothetical protein BC937DRAFT_86223 [Endogone sp. FLAS-F59071]|nr:hypothetical protein BC937DRAFT_86223 [Endogone sp. FLAS-F59071]|eukprot:RUS13170.1 hypothetical protein BC937DRAFT_86223 [Endogone sp. FLAS-F59071]
MVNIDRTFQARPPRVVALDLLRGMLMVLESIDHAKMFLTTWFGPHETWYELKPYSSTALFLIRLATHPCAPGFAFLMGIGIVYFIRSRKGLGWTDRQLVWHFFVRGLLLVIINMLLTWNWFKREFLGMKVLFISTVLFALGINFFIGALVSLLANRFYAYLVRKLTTHSKNGVPLIEVAERRAAKIRITVLLVLAATFCVSNVLLMPDGPVLNGRIEGYGEWRYLLYLPGESNTLFSMYPPMNWFGLSLYGIAFGYILIKDKRDSKSNARFNMVLSLAFFFAFLLVRIPGGFGNINPSLLPPAPPGTLFNNPFLANTQTFFNTIKYAPDLAFSTLFMSVNHFLLALFYLVPIDSPSAFVQFIAEGPLLDYGRSSFFFFIVHHLVYLLSSVAIGLWWPGAKNSEGKVALGYTGFFIVWILGLVIMWRLCRWYAKFKASKGPDSIFRFF